MRAALALLIGLFLLPGLEAADLLHHPKLRTLRVMGPATARQRGVRPGFGVAGSVGSGLFLTSGRKLYEVRTGKWLDPGGKAKLAGLAMLNGELLVTRGRWLLALAGERLVIRAILPESDMRLVAGSTRDVLYLYGGREKGRTIYGLIPDGRYEKIVEVDQPVTALGEAGGEIVFAAGREIYLLARFGKPTLLMRTTRSVFSISLDPRMGMPFFATPAGVYALTGQAPMPLLLGTSGALLHDGRYLVVVDPVEPTVLAIENPVQKGAPKPNLATAGAAQMDFLK